MKSAVGEPRVTHFNDCANVALTLVRAAAAQGHHWNFVPPSKVRPPEGFTSSAAGRARQLPYVARHVKMLLTSDVIHIHYATAAALLEHGFLPRRPYLLHLHGTDIRKQWLEPNTREQIQRAIDGAHTVFYSNLDTAENALTARPDARYMPALLRPETLPRWAPQAQSGGKRKVVFASRWDDSKGLETQLEFAELLVKAVPDSTKIVGLDWGPGAASAKALGVELVPKMSHADYLEYLASADLVVGQSTGLLGVSELEAMGIGPVVACPGRQLEGPAGTPPVLQGSLLELVEQAREVLVDPVKAAEQTESRQWVLKNHLADTWIPVLQDLYGAASDHRAR